MNSVIQAAEEALEIATGKKPAPCIYMNGHAYVPKVIYDIVVKELEELKKKLEEIEKNA